MSPGTETQAGVPGRSGQGLETVQSSKVRQLSSSPLPGSPGTDTAGCLGLCHSPRNGHH